MMIKFKNRLSNKLLASGLVLGLIGLFVPNLVFADLTGTINEILVNIIWVIWLGPCIAILQLEVWLLPIIAQYNKFTRETGVVVGWTALRDLANMFFILILLVIAFATILNIQKFGYKTLLKRLVIMAILINFSMTIVGLLIDLSQVIMLTFVSAIKDVAAGNLVVAFGVSNIFEIDIHNIGSGIVDFISTIFLGGLMMLVVTVVIGVFIAILCMRIAKLWILIVVSPLAFLAYTFPTTEKYFSEWVQDLTKNLISGPSLAFFLWLAFTIVGRGNVNGNFVDASVSGEQVTGAMSAAGTQGNIINFVIALAILIGGLEMVAKSGAAGASIAGQAAAKIKDKASSEFRRRVSGRAMAVGARVAGGFINNEGQFKLPDKLASGFGLSGQRRDKTERFISKVPVWGGRIERQAAGLVGRDAKRQADLIAETQKYISPEYREHFEKAQSPMAYEKTDWQTVYTDKKGREILEKNLPKNAKMADYETATYRVNKDGEYIDRHGEIIKRDKKRGYKNDYGEDIRFSKGKLNAKWLVNLGALGKTIVSGGEAIDHRAAFAQATVDRGKVNENNSKQIAKDLRRIGDEARLDAVLLKQAKAISGLTEATRLVNKFGLMALKNQEQKGMVNPDGSVAQGMKDLHNAILRHKTIDGHELGETIRNMPKKARVEADHALKEVAKNELDEFRGNQIFLPDENDEISTDKKGNFTLDTDNIANKADAGLIHSYPDISKEIIDRSVNAIDLNKIKLNNRSIENLHRDDDNESKEEFDKRLAEAKKEWEHNNTEYESGNRTEEDMYAERRRLMGISDTRDEGGADTIKDSVQDQTKVEKLLAEVKGTMLPEEFTSATENLTAELAKINARQLQPNEDKDTFDRAQSRARSDAIQRYNEQSKYAIPRHTDYAGKAVLSEAADGAHYSRLAEMDLTDPEQLTLFKDLVRRSTQGQQRQLLEEGTPEQTRVFADTLATEGIKINKNILDNLTPHDKKEALIKVAIHIDKSNGVYQNRAPDYYKNLTLDQLIKLGKGESEGVFDNSTTTPTAKTDNSSKPANPSPRRQAVGSKKISGGRKVTNKWQ